MSAMTGNGNLRNDSLASSMSRSEVSLSSSKDGNRGEDLALTQEERQYLLLVQRGDVASVKRMLDSDRPPPYILDINCTDPVGRSAIAIAIENENLDMLEILLEREVEPKDALLQAISEHYVEGVELLLQWEERHYTEGQQYSWEKVSHDAAAYTDDVTPLILAAHNDHYEILKLLLDRGASLPMPHHVKCGCSECLEATKADSLRHSLSRINSYRALASPSLISLSSKDPLLTAFELSAELQRLEGIEHEFKAEYMKLQENVRQYCYSLLDQVRTQQELTVMLNYSAEETVLEDNTASLDRLKLAIKFAQKSFVAHSNVQQLLGAIWYNGLPGFRRLHPTGQLMAVIKLMCMFPVLSICYIIDPQSERSQFLKKPFVKFICHSSSYMFFLTLLALASQRIEYLIIETLGNDYLLSVVRDWKIRERGSLPGPVELLIIVYVFGLVWSEVKALWTDGLLEYLADLWNIADFITNSFFLAWIQLRTAAWIIVRRDLWWYDRWPWYPREAWHAFDPMLLSEGCFGAAMIFSFMKLIHIFSVNHHLGPLQISLGRMVFDILKFFFLYTLVLFAFGCGLNHMLWYYSQLEMQECYQLPNGLPDYENNEDSCYIWRRWANLFESSQSLYWASFGLVELEVFELTGLGSFTRFWCLLMFGGYSTINVIVLLNLLIAMMSNSYQAISEKSDTEWKFARTKLWMSFFEDGASVPPPFNLIPTPKTIKRLLKLGATEGNRGSLKDKRQKVIAEHQNVMRLMVRRYITEKQRKADDRKVTEDDVNEIKQDISTFRFQLIDILKTNGMNTSIASNEDPTVIGRKGRAMERKLMRGFNISRVEGIVNEVLTETKKSGNIFGKIAKAIGSTKRKSMKTDWNAKVSRASMRRDQIGRSQVSLSRSITSIQKRIQYENEQLLQTMNPKKIMEYNPNLIGTTDQTKIAYAKFKVKTIKFEKQTQGDSEEGITNEINGPNSSNDVPAVKYESENQNFQPKYRFTSVKSPGFKKTNVESSAPVSSASTSNEKEIDKLQNVPISSKSKTKAKESEPLTACRKRPTTPTTPKKKEDTSSSDEKSMKAELSAESKRAPETGKFTSDGKSELTGKKTTGWI